MLELPEIKSGDFEEVLERLKKQIPSLCPEWCNVSESSAGIMLLELLTYISLEQQSSMNKISGSALINLGRLLGFSPEHLTPARATAQLHGAAMSGEKLRVDSLVFETEKELVPCGAGVAVFGRCDERGEIVTLCRNNAKTPPQRLFADGNSFVIGLDNSVEAGREIRLALCFDTQGRKIPDGLSEAPWGNLVRWQYYSADGWRDVGIISDGTLSCFRTGELVFRTKKPLAELGGVYPIRCVAEDTSGFDLPPLLTGAYTDSCPVRQTDTKCESVSFDIEAFRSNKMVFRSALAKNKVFRLMINSSVGWCDSADINVAFDVVNEQDGFRLATSSRKELSELFSELDGSEVLTLIIYEQEFVRDFTQFSSDGSANQRIPLNFSGAFAPETELMAAREQDGVLYWHKWRRSDKLAVEPPESRCFAVGPAEGCLVFGDRLHGAVPPSCGRKNIMLTTLRLTNGAEGNIPPCHAGGAEIIAPAHGGKNEDTPDSFFARAVRLQKPETLLTLSDYENAAMATEGILLKSAEAYCTKDRAGNIVPNAVTLMIEPMTAQGDKPEAAPEWYIGAVKSRLDLLRTINTRITVKFPKYIPISVELSFCGTGFTSGAEREAEECIRRYFDENSGGEISSAQLAKRLSELPCVGSVRSLGLSEPVIGGRFAVPEGSRVYLKKCEIYCTDRR